MARVGLVLVGAVLAFCALWLASQPTPPTPTEIDAASMQRLGEQLLRPSAKRATEAWLPGFVSVVIRSPFQDLDDFDFHHNARRPMEFRPGQIDIGTRGFDTWVYEGWRGPARPKEGLPYFWDREDDPEGYRLVARLAAVEGGGWTVEVERMRAEGLDALFEGYGIEERRGRYEVQR